jgi:hypothetical protein
LWGLFDWWAAMPTTCFLPYRAQFSDAYGEQEQQAWERNDVVRHPWDLGASPILCPHPGGTPEGKARCAASRGDASGMTFNLSA